MTAMDFELERDAFGRLVLVLPAAAASPGRHAGVQPVRAVGTSSACGIFIGLGSALGYALQAPAGALPLPGAVGYVYLPAAIGVALASVLAAPYGTRLAHALSGPALKRVFAVFLLAVGCAFAYSAT